LLVLKGFVADITSGIRMMGLEALLARLAHFDLPAPLGFEDLGGGDAAGGIRVEDRVDNIATSGL
jgi:hypothetical protein